MCKFCLSSDSSCRPFLLPDSSFVALRMKSAWHAGRWGEMASTEETAYLLSQVTANNVLPRLIGLACGSDLLRYEVYLRSRMSGIVIDELRTVAQETDTDWTQVDSRRFLCVIGAGVAASLDVTPGCERLSLRYASQVEHLLFLAGCTVDLPRSRLFLQTTLDEKFELLLRPARTRLLAWLCG